MPRDARAFVWDASTAVDAIIDFTRGRSLEDYLRDAMLRSAVERELGPLRERLHQLLAELGHLP